VAIQELLLVAAATDSGSIMGIVVVCFVDDRAVLGGTPLFVRTAARRRLFEDVATTIGDPRIRFVLVSRRLRLRFCFVSNDVVPIAQSCDYSAAQERENRSILNCYVIRFKSSSTVR